MAGVLAAGGGSVMTLDDELTECSTCALWEPLADRSNDGDRYTHSDESRGFWLEKEAS